jgi:SHS2 domain-containing protein
MQENSARMTIALVRYDAARKALAAAHRVDEVKAIRDKAEAVRVYAKQARNLEMQNMAAEIRLRAERRAGELLVDMQASGERQAKERGRPKKVSRPTTLPKLGISRDQSSKWQRLAIMGDSALP